MLPVDVHKKWIWEGLAIGQARPPTPPHPTPVWRIAIEFLFDINSNSWSALTMKVLINM